MIVYPASSYSMLQCLDAVALGNRKEIWLSKNTVATLGVVGVAGGALSQGWEKILGSAFPGIIISWKHIQLNNIIRAIFHT